MKQKSASRAFICCLALSTAALSLSPAVASEHLPSISTQDVIWTSPSDNAGDSMPIGGGDMGANVWVEDGDLLLYMERSGFFDENNTQLKAGRLRISLDPDPFADPVDFSQRLNLEEGRIEITATGADGSDVHITVWVEIDRPILHVEVDSEQRTTVTADYETWRAEDKIHVKTWNLQQKAFAYLFNDDVDVYTRADTVSSEEDAVWFYQRNPEETIFDIEVEGQGLSDVKDQMWNPMRNRTFGGVFWGKGLVQTDEQAEGVYGVTPYRGYRLKSEKPRKRHRLNVALHVDQTETLAAWRADLDALKDETASGVRKARRQHKAYWSDFWSRGRIHVNTDTADQNDKGWIVGRNYQLGRFMLGTNSRGDIPTKFNGHFYLVDPLYSNLEGHVFDYVDGAELMAAETPDFRMWGGGSFTAQNQRLVYWPMIKNGDFDLMAPQFKFYENGLVNAELRTREYWGHGGASFTEQMNFYGLPLMSHYGWERTDLPDGDDWILRYLWSNQLEFAYMMLEARRFSGEDISAYLPYVHSAIQFYDNHYRYRRERATGSELDESGKLVLEPSSSAEAYIKVINPTDLVSALTALTDEMLNLPSEYLTESERDYYGDLEKRLPGINLREKDGHTVIAPGVTWEATSHSVDFPQMYTVFPYGLYGLGEDSFQLALDTWRYGNDTDRQKEMIGWQPGLLYAARLGLTQEAKERVIFKLDHGPVRFPAFLGPDFDWLPDMNKIGVGMVGLQEMLLQTRGSELRLLPAWPEDWDADFKLYAPMETIVEGTVRDGAITYLKVTPESRAKDLIISEPFSLLKN